MATVIRPQPQQNRFAGLESLIGGLIQGQDKRIRRENLLEGLTPDQRNAVGGLPLAQLTAVVQANANNALLGPVQAAQKNSQFIVSQGNATDEQLTNFRAAGFIPQQRQQARPTTLTPEQLAKKERISAGLEPRATRPGKTKLTYKIKDSEGNDINQTVFVDDKHAESASDLINDYSSLDPDEIFFSHVNGIAEQEGMVSFNDKGELEMEDDEVALDSQAIQAVIPDIVKASVVKNKNPVDALESFYQDWETFKFTDKGKGIFNLEGEVSLSKAAPLPSKEDQGKSIIDSVWTLLSEDQQEEIALLMPTNPLDLNEVNTALAKAKVFLKPKGRPTR